MTDRQIKPGWTPREMADYYGWPEDAHATGQTIAIIDLGEVLDPDEMKVDLAKLGLDHIDFEIVPVDGAKGPTPGPAIETHIDLEIIASLCPEARIRVYFCKQSFAALAKGIAQATDDGCDVITISWGAPESSLSSGDIYRINKALEAAAAAGVSVCAASGDAGASGLVDPKTYKVINDPSGRVHAVFPASSPFVLACGGTALMRGDDKALYEVAWNNTDAGGRATGGGVSAQFDPPDWQKGLDVPSVNRGAAPGRILPDVSALAAVGAWAFYDKDGTLDPEGGTSAVAPFFAAICAVANTQRIQSAKPRLGFVNPRLYQLARGGKLFHDITKGDNRVCPGGNGYAAQTGFDACTGWGTPRAEKLIAALAALD